MTVDIVNSVEVGFETIQYSSSFTGTPADPVRLVRAAKRAGFSWISFDRWTLAEQAARPGGLAALRDTCVAEALPCREVQSLRISADSAADRRAFEGLLDQVRILEPDTVPVILTLPPAPELVAALRDRVLRLLEVRPTLRLAIEFGPVFGVGTPSEAVRLADDLGDPRVGLLLDSWHVFTGATTWRELRTLEIERVALVQLGDSAPLSTGDIETARYHRRLPGDGVLPLDRFLALLDERSYAGLLSVEVISAELRTLSPEDYAVATFTSFRRLGNRSGIGVSGNSRRQAIRDGWAT